jgi:hypothetical protein
LIRDDLGLAWVNNTGSHESQHLWGSDVDDVGRRGFPPLLYLSDLVLRECRSVSSSTMPIGHFLYIAWSETGHHNYELVDAPYHERDSVRCRWSAPWGGHQPILCRQESLDMSCTFMKQRIISICFIRFCSLRIKASIDYDLGLKHVCH